MFKKLKQHWRVNSLNLGLIITTFALGGSLCGYAGRKILLLLHIDKGIGWILLYTLLILLLWPVCVILISVPMGQFPFFKRYITRIWNKFRGTHKTRIAIFASGAGSNAQEIINYFYLSSTAKIALVVCNKPGAGVLTIAKTEKIPSLLIKKEAFENGDHYLAELRKHKIDFIVLAGFLWKVPGPLIEACPKKIVNIHPALLPKYGGAGMYGHYVHEAVISNKETESGITVHYVDAQYDHGETIFQARCPVDPTDTPATLAEKILRLEHANYPAVIGKIISND
jgi:formyltetrahydrofolate-dependent phosphoribosylglycinamide formyltransferase